MKIYKISKIQELLQHSVDKTAHVLFLQKYEFP